MTQKNLRFADKKSNNQGFTLTELLVAFLVLNVLVVISVPRFIKQSDKARQSEAKSTLGTINRAQQAYRLENATFGSVSYLPIKVGNDNGDGTYTAQYYIFDGGNNDPLYTTHHANANTLYQNDLLNYQSAVGQKVDGTFTNIICESTTTTADDAATNHASGDVFCSGGKPIR